MCLRDKVNIQNKSNNLTITVVRNKEQIVDKYVIEESTGSMTKYTSKKDVHQK